LIARIKRAAEQALEGVDKANSETEKEMSDVTNAIQKSMDSLVQLSQRVNYALTGADADKVCIIKT
jgi:hypothetical protein